VLLTLRAENTGDEFGRHASGIGDVNHDGFADLIVGDWVTMLRDKKPDAPVSIPERMDACY